jgi:hypothetical protein
MKNFLLIFLAIALTGCANSGWLTTNSNKKGYKNYDPCIRCGEKWDQIPNRVGEAQLRRAEGETW